MKYRIFYAPQVYRTWEKIFILTSDGKLYCEYLMRFNKQTIKRDGIDYDNFAPKNISWGKGVQGDQGTAYTNYQGCDKELSLEEYKNLKPSRLLSGYGSSVSRQIRWVPDYLRSIGLELEDWDQEKYDIINS